MTKSTQLKLYGVPATATPSRGHASGAISYAILPGARHFRFTAAGSCVLSGGSRPEVSESHGHAMRWALGPRASIRNSVHEQFHSF